ncbi:MAG: hypothetical protein U5R31_16905 [Acidimicrobiia bacterium]|nr:hypothetical protein [Acidimicrobiia bacterium]
MPAILLSVVVLIVAHEVVTIQEINRTSDMSDRIYAAVKDYLHVTRLGPPDVAAEYIAARIPSLSEVRNTSFNIAEQAERAQEKFYATKSYDEMLDAAATGTARGLHWRDVGDEFSIPRLRALRASSETLAKGRRSTYAHRLIMHDEPQLNFIILDFKDGSREALFNWDFLGLGKDPTVLVSRDRDIVEMFAIHFEHLWRAASPDHDSDTTTSTSTK